MKYEKNKFKKILKFCHPISYITTIILALFFMYIKPNLLLSSLAFIIPGIYSLSFAIIYREFEDHGTYRDRNAIIISISTFWLFILIGLPGILKYFRYTNQYNSWLTLIVGFLVLFCPRIIVNYLDKNNKIPISKLNYWIQSSNLNLIDGESSLTLKEAYEFITKYNWDKELRHKKTLELSKKENIPPTIGLDYQGQVFTISCSYKGYYDLHFDTGNDRRDIKNLNSNELFTLMEYYYKKEYNKIFNYYSTQNVDLSKLTKTTTKKYNHPKDNISELNIVNEDKYYNFWFLLSLIISTVVSIITFIIGFRNHYSIQTCFLLGIGLPIILFIVIYGGSCIGKLFKKIKGEKNKKIMIIILYSLIILILILPFIMVHIFKMK